MYFYKKRTYNDKLIVFIGKLITKLLLIAVIKMFFLAYPLTTFARMSSVNSRTVKIHLKTLTPLGTGGVEPGKVDRIRETSIIGSLRWWFEVLVRGVGGYVMEPTNDNKSGLDTEIYDEWPSVKKHNPACLREAGLCDVSQIFGATNWRRRFRLQIVDSTTPETEENVHKDITLTEYEYYSAYNKKMITPTWWFPKLQQDKPRSGNLILKIIPLSSDFNPTIIEGLLQFIADWGALGAKTQMGFGVIALANGHIDTRPLYRHLMKIKGSNNDTGLPSLKNIFFTKIRQKNGNRFEEQDSFILKYRLRQLFAEKSIRHFIMGTVYHEKMAAKINMSRPYNNDKIIKIWGWIPELDNRIEIRDTVYNYLLANYNLNKKDWKEFNLPSHTSDPADIDPFLRELLCIKEEEK